MQTVELSEYHNYAIQNDQNPISDQDEEEKETSVLSSRKERLPSRISCTHRTLAQNYRQQIGLSVGNNLNAEQAPAEKTGSSTAVRGGVMKKAGKTIKQ